MAKDQGKSRLSQLHEAHARNVRTYTPRMEDYLEVIYELIKVKGYATAVDISDHLHVKAPSVTGMMQKLRDDGFLIYEKYRGMTLTPEGERIAKAVRERHIILVEFLKLLGVHDGTAQEDAEGLEHYLHPETVKRFAAFVSFVVNNPKWFKPLEKHILARKS